MESLIDNELPALFGGKPVRNKEIAARNPFGKEEEKEVIEALRSGNLFYPTGKKVYQFLEKVKRLFGVERVVASTSGTAAIHVAIGSINIEPGDEIIVPPVTDMGSVAPIILSGGIPVFVDVKPQTFNLDPEDLERKITSRTRAVIVVHTWGRPADLDEIMRVIKDKHILLIEDCAQAHYVMYKGKPVGTFGDFGCFSFQQSKHITCGDGGLTLVNNKEYLQRATLFVDKGCDWTEDRVYRKTYAFIAPCYRMSELQGAVLCAQIDKLPDIIKRRERNGKLLIEKLQDIPGIIPPLPPDDMYGHGFWGFPLRVIEEEIGVSCERFREALKAEGIKNSVWIGKPLYLYEALAQWITFGNSSWPFRGTDRDIKRYTPGLCPNSELVMRQLCNIDRIHENTTEEEIDNVATAIKKLVKYFRPRK